MARDDLLHEVARKLGLAQAHIEALLRIIDQHALGMTLSLAEQAVIRRAREFVKAA